MIVRNRRKFIAMGGIAIVALVIAMVTDFTPRMVWNATPSAPVGLYHVQLRAPSIGEFALVEHRGEAAELLAERRYLPPGVPLIKRVSARSGDEICRLDERILVNNIHVADALFEDSLGRFMPEWSGCFMLKNNEIFLLNAHEKSLDGRYFWVTKMDEIIGVAIPVFVWEAGE